MCREVLPLRNAVRFMQKVLIVLGKYYQRKDGPLKVAVKNKKRKRSTEDDKENSNKGKSPFELFLLLITILNNLKRNILKKKSH